MKTVAGALAAAILFAAGTNAQVSEAPILHGWIVEWDAQAGLEAVRAHPGDYNGISLFSYQFDEKGNLVPANPELPDLAQKIKQSAPQTPLTVSVVNDVGDKSKDSGFIKKLLSSPGKRRKHIKQLVDLSRGFDGLEIDYENFRPGTSSVDRQNFSSFIAELKERLPADKKLAVDVEADSQGLDWKAIANNADSLNVMAYYSHWAGSGPGALCEFDLLEKMARDINRLGIPPSKVLVILPTYGFDWPEGEPGKQLEHEEAKNIQQREGNPPLQRDTEMNPYFTYVSERKGHTVFYEDGLSLKQKTDKLRELGFTRIGLWRLGKGPADF